MHYLTITTLLLSATTLAAPVLELEKREPLNLKAFGSIGKIFKKPAPKANNAGKAAPTTESHNKNTGVVPTPEKKKSSIMDKVGLGLTGVSLASLFAPSSGGTSNADTVDNGTGAGAGTGTGTDPNAVAKRSLQELLGELNGLI